VTGNSKRLLRTSILGHGMKVPNCSFHSFVRASCKVMDLTSTSHVPLRRANPSIEDAAHDHEISTYLCGGAPFEFVQENQHAPEYERAQRGPQGLPGEGFRTNVEDDLRFHRGT
jgi:hypothetical protein